MSDLSAASRCPHCDRWLSLVCDTCGDDFSDRIEALVRDNERLRTDMERLCAFIIYSRCADCGLYDPLRRDVNCDRCRTAAALLKEVVVDA